MKQLIDMYWHIQVHTTWRNM